MENFTITAIDLKVKTEDLTNKSPEELKVYINDTLCPLILTHLTTKPKGSEINGSIGCTVDRGGVICSGSIGGSIKF